MTLTWQWIGYHNMYLQYHLMVISSEEPEEKKVGISQMSPVLEQVVAEEKVYLGMDKVKEEDLDMDKVKEEDLDRDEVEVEEAVEAALVDVAVMVDALEEEAIAIVTTTMEGRITIMELIHQILQENLHLKKFQILFKLMYGVIFVPNEGQIKGGSIIKMTVISQQE